MYRLVTFKFLALLTFALCASPLLSHAQTNAIKIQVTPTSPKPYETVTVSIEDYSQDLNKIEMKWSVNGEVVSSGPGLKRIQTKTGAIGTAQKIDINIGGDIKTVTVRPTATDLLWQADTYTPPFYKGKALHSSQDPIMVHAEPFIVNTSGTRLDPNKLVYKWKLNGNVNATASGTGKKTFKVVPSILPKPAEISVEITSTDNVYRSEASIVVPTSNPEIVLYENHPLYGIRTARALNGKDFALTSSEANIVAEPFFFSRNQKDFDLLTYSWSLNNSSVNQEGNEIVVRKPTGEGSGKSQISLTIKNLERILQTANATMYAVYNNSSDTQNQNVF